MRLRIIYIRGFSKTLLGLSILTNNKRQMVTQLSDPDMPQFRNIPTYFTNNMITFKKKYIHTNFRYPVAVFSNDRTLVITFTISFYSQHILHNWKMWLRRLGLRVHILLSRQTYKLQELGNRGPRECRTLKKIVSNCQELFFWER